MKITKPGRAYEYIIQHVKDEIFKGNLVRGQKLPPEREMAEELGVGRNAVREALRALSIMGFISSSQGAGNFVTCDFRGSFDESIRMMLLMEEISYKDINDLRHGLESFSARIAAGRLTPEKISEFLYLLEELEKETNPDRCARLDKELHTAITYGGGNILISHILDGLSPALEEHIHIGRAELYSDPEKTKILKKTHRTIIEGIVAQDLCQIDRGFQDHLDYTFNSK